MIITKEVIDKYPNSIEEFVKFIGLPISALHMILFHHFVNYFDNKGLFIGITCDPDGLFWIPEICSNPLKVCNSRKAAQDLAIKECFKMLEEMQQFEVK